MSDAQSAHFLGIDLGTTNSCACISDGKTVSPVRASQGGVLTPSVVRMDAKGNTLIGQRARRYLDSDPDNTRAEFKRLMGTENTLKFAASGAEKKPEELAALVLSAIRSDVERDLGFAPKQAVITVPALFELPQSRATSDAARLAGFDRIELLQEPVASALAAGWKEAGHGPWLVYDLGGGTFDVSLLEPQEGLLRVMGHDGDNFLGGRDIDAKMLDHVLAVLEQEQSLKFDRRDPSIFSGIRRLRTACEEAKLESSCGKDAIVSIPALALGSQTVDIDVLIPKRDMQALALSIVDPSLLVCLRLLKRHGLEPSQLDRIVLVGGPTMMPILRERVTAVLNVKIAEGLDPMTLVAEGAALFAQTSDLRARGLDSSKASVSVLADLSDGHADNTPGIQTWFQYPAVTGDLGPYVVGKVMAQSDREKVAAVVFVRTRDGWESKAEALDAEGTFASVLKLDERTSTSFRTFAIDKDGKRMPLEPKLLSLRHGITIGDPPLPRSIGVALENGGVHVFFERGAPLPIRRSYTLNTATPLGATVPGSKLSIPIVQGEFPIAELCRLVGNIEIDGADVPSPVRPGTRVEVSLSVDRGGELRGSCKIDGIDKAFDHVAHLVAPSMSPEQVRAFAHKARERLSYLHSTGDSESRIQAETLDAWIDDIDRLADAGEGGDADALEKARRRLLDLDGELHELDAKRAWPMLEAECDTTKQYVIVWVGRLGTDTERGAMEKSIKSLDAAIHARDAAGVRRHIRYLDELGSTCYSRDPESWVNSLEYYASRVEEAFDLPKATQLVSEGRAAAARDDNPAVKNAVVKLRALLPSNAQDKKRSLGSGVR
jgi:molecular chaperone DnaK